MRLDAQCNRWLGCRAYPHKSQINLFSITIDGGNFHYEQSSKFCNILVFK